MRKENRCTIKELKKHFHTTEQCLKYLFESRHRYACACGGRYRMRLEKMHYQCSKCRTVLTPMKGTIFFRSHLPLSDWFYVLFLFSSAKNGIAAAEVQRHIGCTYKTAWRMFTLLRDALSADDTLLQGIVEMDEAYFGGRQRRKGTNGEYNKISNKQAVIGAVERNGSMVNKIVPNISVPIIESFLRNTVSPDALLQTDGSTRYRNLPKQYKREQVCHRKGEYVRGKTHINTIENYWSNVKRSLKGTHKVISEKYLQLYLNGFVFHHNNRHSDRERFYRLVDAAVLC